MNELIQTLAYMLSKAGQRASGMMLPPELRSVMPGVNETQTLQRAAQQQMPYVDPALVRSLMGAGVTVGARPVFHGTPSGVAGQLPLSEMGQKFGPMVGSKGHFVIESPGPASAYSEGSISEANSLLGKGDYAPNVRPYMMAEHQSLGTHVPVTQKELDGILEAINNMPFAPKQNKYGLVSPEVQRSNLSNAVQSGVLPEVSPGEQLRGILTGMLGQQGGEDVLRAGGYKSIFYPGEHPSTMGMENAQAYKVLDNSVLSNLFDYLSGQPK